VANEESRSEGPVRAAAVALGEAGGLSALEHPVNRGPIEMLLAVGRGSNIATPAPINIWPNSKGLDRHAMNDLITFAMCSVSPLAPNLEAA
jgi:hypothetical protein